MFSLRSLALILHFWVFVCACLSLMRFKSQVIQPPHVRL